MISNKQNKYVLIRENGEAVLISDPIKTWQDSKFDKDKDRIYCLGEEVAVKTTIEVKNKTTYRERSYPEGTR